MGSELTRGGFSDTSAIPPPPMASPTFGQPPSSHSSSPAVNQLAVGSLIEVKAMGLVGTSHPPRFAPPSYMVHAMHTPSGDSTASPPPMHTPVCATPASQQGVTPASQQSNSSYRSRCFPAGGPPVVLCT